MHVVVDADQNLRMFMDWNAGGLEQGVADSRDAGMEALNFLPDCAQKAESLKL